MIVDKAALNPAFPDGSMPEEDLTALMAWTRSQLGLNGSRPWKLISARRKLGKTLFEIEEERAEGPVRLIAKIARDERTRVTYTALRTLWEAGFRLPSQYTVVEPVAWLAERDLVILERAPGVELVEKVEANVTEALPLVQETALWLVRLHKARVDYEPWPEETRLSTWVGELSELALEHAGRLRSIAEAARRGLAGSTEDLVPCHGDFHLLNMFVADSGRLTGIDVDKFGGREAVEEVGYFLAQAASIGFHRLGSFEASLPIRDSFLQTYESDARLSFSRRKLGGHMAITLIKNLHFDLFAYKSGRLHILPAWLDAAERCARGDIEFS